MFFHFLFFELHFWGLKPYLDIEFEDLKTHFQNKRKHKTKREKRNGENPKHKNDGNIHWNNPNSDRQDE